MRFYCPKCDLKYRMDDDKLNKQPNAQMRCKACHTVFSVQVAVRVANDRKADGRAPVDGGDNLSLPPPKPAPLAWKSTAPVVSSPPGKGVVTMPLLDVTARPRIEPNKQVNVKPGGVTKPGLAPNTRGLSIGPKAGQRGASLLAAKSLRSSDRANPPQVKLSTQRAPELEVSQPAQILGRGSAQGFPPVTEERTHPVVPPLPRVTKEPVSSMSDHLGTRDLIVAEPDAHDDNLEANLELIEAEPRITPVVAFEPSASTGFGDDDGLAVRDDDASWAEFREQEYAPDVEEPTATVPVFEAVSNPAPREAHEEYAVRGVPAAAFGVPAIAQEHAARPVAESEWEPPIAAVKRGVSKTIALMLAVVCGAGGFGAGYTMGSKSEHSSASTTAAAAAAAALEQVDQGQRRMHSEPAPPPPPEDDTLAQTAVSGETVGQGGGPLVVAAASHGVAVLHNAQGGQTLLSRAGTAAVPVATGAGLDGLADPVAGPSTLTQGNAKASTEAGLSERAIQSTVQRFQPGIRRTCWQPAISRGGSAPGASARVTTTLTIAPTGRVTGVTLDGEPAGFPGLGACIASRVKAWKFPRAKSGTTAAIPFVFAAQ